MTKGAIKRLVFNQLLIVLVTGYLFFSGRTDLYRTAVLFVLMELGAVVGAWWGSRLQRQMAANRERLPIDRR